MWKIRPLSFKNDPIYFKDKEKHLQPPDDPGSLGG
jgi:hypothetical protein